MLPSIDPYRVPNGHHVVNVNVLGCGRVRRPQVIVVHEHDCDVVADQTTPIVTVGRDTSEPEQRLVPVSRAFHVIGLEHRNKSIKAHGYIRFQKWPRTQELRQGCSTTSHSSPRARRDARGILEVKPIREASVETASK
jgi:hypothetical protein